MAASKRKEIEENPDGDRTGKKIKTDEDNCGSQTPPSDATKAQGYDDDFIEWLFDELRSSIRNLSLEKFRGFPYRTARTNQHKEVFENLTSLDFVVYLKSEQDGPKHSIIQAAIWKILIERLLSAPTNAFFDMQEAGIRTWALRCKGPGELLFCTPKKAFLTSSIIDARKAFYSWRFSTAQSLPNIAKQSGAAWDENGSQRKDFITETINLLIYHASQQKLDDLEEKLDKIADQAFELAKAMACCRAGWICTMRYPQKSDLHGFTFKTDSMEKDMVWDEDEELSTVVDLITAPMLIKIGNARGDNFGQCRVVRKAQVGMKPKKDTV